MIEAIDLIWWGGALGLFYLVVFVLRSTVGKLRR